MVNMTDLIVELDEVSLGREVVAKGHLRNLRNKLGWSCNAMAEALLTSTITYATWESRPDTRLWNKTAGRIGTFYRDATQILSEFQDIDSYQPFYKVAMRRGIPQEYLLAQYRDGRVDGVDLDVLGLWMRI
jgi:hypothetical protein